MQFKCFRGKTISSVAFIYYSTQCANNSRAEGETRSLYSSALVPGTHVLERCRNRVPSGLQTSSPSPCCGLPTLWPAKQVIKVIQFPRLVTSIDPASKTASTKPSSLMSLMGLTPISSKVCSVDHMFERQLQTRGFD